MNPLQTLLWIAVAANPSEIDNDNAYTNAIIFVITSIIIGAKLGKNVRTTVSLPKELVEATDRAVREGKARSRNEFLSIALRHELATLEQARINEAFGAMANDPLYGEEAEKLVGEFERASWEAFKAAEGGEKGG